MAEFFKGLPHHVERESDRSMDEKYAPFIRDDGLGRKVSALARAAAKLPADRLEIAVELIKALKPRSASS